MWPKLLNFKQIKLNQYNMFFSIIYFQRHVQTAELIQIDRLFVADIQNEIAEMQYDITNANTNLNQYAYQHQQTNLNQQSNAIIAQPPPMQTSAIIKQQIFQKINDNYVKKEMSELNDLKNEIKMESDIASIGNTQTLNTQFNNSCSILVSNATIKKQEDNVKKEMDGFDIESEITTSFIMKNNDYNVQTSIPTTVNTSNAYVEISDVDKNSEPYDEWLCIQKELGYIAKQDENKSSNHQHSKTMENELSEIFSDQSPKSVEKQLDEIFNPPSGKHHHHDVDDSSPLSEFFNTDSMGHHHHHHNQEQQQHHHHHHDHEKLLFDEDSRNDHQLDKMNSSDLVETRLEALFQGTIQHGTSDGNENFISKETNSIDHQNSMNEFMMIAANTNTRNKMWNNGERSYDSRWIMDQQHQNFDYDITSRLESSLKRSWNGDMDILGQGNNKKMCFNNQKINTGGSSCVDLERDILGLSDTGSPQSLIDHHFQTNLLHNNFDSLTGASSSSSVGGHHLHHHLHHNHHQSNFDDDINRHVQNAIDSILNLQNSDSDSLHFSLDQSISSFLSENPISTTPRPPSVAKRKCIGLSTGHGGANISHNSSSIINSNQCISDDISDLLNENNRDDMMIIDSPVMHVGNELESSVSTDYNDVGVMNTSEDGNQHDNNLSGSITDVDVGSGGNNSGNNIVDDACKSIITS